MSDVGLKETLGHIPWGLARLYLGEFAIMSSLGLKPPSDIEGLELQFFRDFCPESLLPLSVVETSMLLVVQLWVLLFLAVSECSTNPGSLGC